MQSSVRPTRVYIALGIAVAMLAAWVWLSDYVTLQGERTIYTVDCAGGEWKGETCTGHLVPAERYRFRALHAHREVLFWTVGATTERSGRFGDCDIHDGRNWSCQPSADSMKSITLQIRRGMAIHDPLGRVRPFHAVEKWRWLMLRRGWPAGNEADE